jgi:hypothetical protein
METGEGRNKHGQLELAVLGNEERRTRCETHLYLPTLNCNLALTGVKIRTIESLPGSLQGTCSPVPLASNTLKSLRKVMRRPTTGSTPAEPGCLQLLPVHRRAIICIVGFWVSPVVTDLVGHGNLIQLNP